ncbi:terminase large subunit domain-containing protein [Thermopirellula anaerolimosa]
MDDRDPLHLPPALRELARRRARDGLLAFTRWTFPEYAPHWHHRLICRTLDRWRRGEVRNLILSMPPRHGKTELVSRRLPALLLGCNPDARIIIAAHTASLAESNSRDVQRCVESERFQQLFRLHLPAPGRRGGRYKRTDAHWEIPGRKGYLRAVGVGGSITGFGFDCGIVDDPVRCAEDAESSVVRDRLWDWFTRDFWTRRAAGARVCVTMTRWNQDDLVGRILRLSGRGLGNWEVLTLPALAGPSGSSHPDDPRRPGEALWPELISAEELRDIEATDPRGFAALYQQDPKAAGGTEFPEEYFADHLWVPVGEWPTRDQLDPLVMAVDPSRGRDDAASDYAAIVWAGMHKHSDLVFVDCDLEVRSPNRTLERALGLFDTLRPDFVAVETNQFQILFAQELERRGRQGFRVSLPLVYIQNTLPKILRVRRLGPWLAARQLRIADTPHGRLLGRQLAEFPIGRHDDGPDALEMACRVLTQHAPRRVESLTYRPGGRDSLRFEWR